MGTIINSVGIILGSLLGLLLKKGIGESLKNSIIRALGLCTFLIGLMGANKSFSDNSLILILSILVGTTVGEALKLEDRLDNIGYRLKHLLKRDKDAGFIDGFINNTIIVTVGAMAIIGSINDGINGDISILLAKTVLDTVISIVFTSMYGIGAMFAVIPLFLYQGSITILAKWVSPLLSDIILRDISLVGGLLIVAIAINMMVGKRFKATNMLPSLFIPPIYYLMVYIVNKWL